ncbi:MAG TPA: Crp/Fnr family transcriptional regulator [Marinobacter sp.]|nr:Crp/Fnr family transcriptional regulator [Marinobacter sp.]
MTAKLHPDQNYLLAALPKSVRDRIFPRLNLAELTLGDVIHESGQLLKHVYFPVMGFVSMLYVMLDGASAEIAVIGSEGMVGVVAFMGGESAPNRAVVQSPGFAYQMSAADFMTEFNRDDNVRSLVLRYTQSLIAQMSQTAACNRHHSIDQQLSRWLLLSLDRVPGNRLMMTQERIANMLGVRREGVTEAAGKLQKRGVIKYNRGCITVIDRPALEALCCECYAVVKKEAARLTAFDPIR